MMYVQCPMHMSVGCMCVSLHWSTLSWPQWGHVLSDCWKSNAHRKCGGLYNILSPLCMCVYTTVSQWVTENNRGRFVHSHTYPPINSSRYAHSQIRTHRPGLIIMMTHKWMKYLRHLFVSGELAVRRKNKWSRNRLVVLSCSVLISGQDCRRNSWITAFLALFICNGPPLWSESCCCFRWDLCFSFIPFLLQLFLNSSLFCATLLLHWY